MNGKQVYWFLYRLPGVVTESIGDSMEWKVDEKEGWFYEWRSWDRVAAIFENGKIEPGKFETEQAVIESIQETIFYIGEKAVEGMGKFIELKKELGYESKIRRDN